MGRIKSALVKRTAKKMLREDNAFTPSFEDDKKILASSMPSKKVRNKIAGYLARLRKVQASQELELKRVLDDTQKSKHQ